MKGKTTFWASVFVLLESKIEIIVTPIPDWFWYAGLLGCVALLSIVGFVLWVLLRKPPHP